MFWYYSTVALIPLGGSSAEITVWLHSYPWEGLMQKIPSGHYSSQYNILAFIVLTSNTWRMDCPLILATASATEPK